MKRVTKSMHDLPHYTTPFCVNRPKSQLSNINRDGYACVMYI